MEKRKLKRRHLIYYLEVFNKENGELLGHLVDITIKGIKLVSREPLPLNADFHLRMNLPEEYFQEKELLFHARTLWYSNDVNPDFYDTGFEVLDLGGKAQLIIADLINQLGFQD